MAASATRKILLISCITVVLGFTIGILIGRFATCPGDPGSNDDTLSTTPTPQGTFLHGVPESIIKDGDPSISQKIMNAIDKVNIEEYLRKLSELPHIAGRPENEALARDLQKFWLENGVDDVMLAPYDVLLSYPDKDHPNYVRLLDNSGGIVYESPKEEEFLTPGENKSNVVPPFSAYSPPGVVQGEMVYVNYGRVEDYDWLESNTNINVSGKIVIVRYGKIYRGSKVDIAVRHGAKGIIIYSDPADYTWGDNPPVYPDTWWLPPSGAQRGTIFVGTGDPITPDYPAIGTAYRYNQSDVDLPKIPCHPIGYGIAENLLKEMDGVRAPPDWRGKLNVPYNLGPSFKNKGWQIQLDISTSNTMATIYNVIGIIRGAVEPDRYVMLGNHRDAWVFGAIDPSGGTAVLQEIGRVMGQLAKSGQWRPRRSIVFLSWGAEEYGLVGSTEWTENYIKNLKNRAVAYLNVDIAVQGNYSLRGSGNPLLYQPLYEAAKKVPNPDPDDIAAGIYTVYDKWLASFPQNNINLPNIGSLGSGSDYAPLLDRAGVTSVDFRYTFNTNKYDISSYPLYHSMYETFYAVKNLIDRDFQYHLAMARLWAELARSLADSLIIPFNVTDYSIALHGYSSSLTSAHGNTLKQHIKGFDKLDEVIANFTKEMLEFESRVSKINRENPMVTRMVNDQLMLLEKAFLDPNGLPLRPWLKHLLMAENSNDAYAAASFPGLDDLLFEIEKHPERWEEVKRHFSVILFTIQSAASTLRDVTHFINEYL